MKKSDPSPRDTSFAEYNALVLGMRILVFLGLLLVGPACEGQGVELMKLEPLRQTIQQEQRVQVINFWATWCGPCLKELPLFEKLNGERSDIRILLVSLDMDLDPDPQKVRSFVARKKLKSTVIILDERNPNEWIDKLEKSWSGAIPATLVINNKTGKRRFVERELHAGELEKLISEIE
ncbi:MAG: TlpA disulfide reductase family protein [Cytophagales bacterium]|nr:TlpA disulfide reductase family protein [Cytophagales bacterium]